MSILVSSETLQNPHFTDSKLSPAQQEEVQGSDFIEWFGDWQGNPEGSETSKIIDVTTGEPQLFYHGTNRLFDISAERDNTPRLSNCGLDHDYEAIYVTGSEEFAKQYADPLGAEWEATTSHLARIFEAKSFADVSEIWNSMMRSCADRDGEVTVSEAATGTAKEYGVGEMEDRLRAGDITYTYEVKFKGKTVMWLGEFLPLVGGSFPAPEDELVAYTSFYPKVQATLDVLEKHGVGFVVPARAEPRIIPVFVKALNPLTEEVADSSLQAMDSAFAAGLHTVETSRNGKYDAVIADGKGTISGVNIAVLDTAQLREASHL